MFNEFGRLTEDGVYKFNSCIHGISNETEFCCRMKGSPILNCPDCPLHKEKEREVSGDE